MKTQHDASNATDTRQPHEERQHTGSGGGERRDVSAGADADKADDALPLPHEADQDPESQHEDTARGIGKQAHRDVERGLKDTDRRGGDEYQQRTQNDQHANENSDAKPDNDQAKRRRH